MAPNYNVVLAEGTGNHLVEMKIDTLVPNTHLVYLLGFGVTISVDFNPVCVTSAVTFTSSVYPASSNYTYQWYYRNNLTSPNGVAINGATGTTYTLVPVHNDIYFLKVYSNIQLYDLKSNEIQMIVRDKSVVSVIISKDPIGSICTGSTVTFTAIGVNSGTTPSYQWFLNEGLVGSNSNIYTGNTFAQDDIISCDMTNTTDSCVVTSTASSNSIAISYIQKVTPSLSIICSPTGSTCSGSTINFLVCGVTYGGSNPTYQWRKAPYLSSSRDIPGSTGNTYSYAPTNGDSIQCYMGSNYYCVTSSGVTSNSIGPLTVSTLNKVNCVITASPSGITCTGTTVTYTATGSNSGTTASNFKWYVNNVSGITMTGKTYSFIPVNNDSVKCVLNSNVNCPTENPATSNTIISTVLNYEDLKSEIQSTPPYVYTGGQYVTYIISGTTVNFYIDYLIGDCDSAIYRWYKNGVSGTTMTGMTYSYAPLSGDTIYLKTTSGCPCVTNSPYTSITILIKYSGTTARNVSISGITTACSGDTVTMWATSNGYSSPVYKWYKNTTTFIMSGSTLSHSGFSNGNTVECHCTEVGGGFETTSNIRTLTINPNVVPTVHIDVDPSSSICNGNTATFYVTSSGTTNGGSNPSYQWYMDRSEIVNPVGSNSDTYTGNTFIDQDIIYVMMTSNASCASPTTVTSNSVTLTVNAYVTPSVQISMSPTGYTCSGNTVTFTATPTNGGTNPSYQWYLNLDPVGTNSNIYSGNTFLNLDWIYCEMVSNAPCIYLGGDVDIVDYSVKSNDLFAYIEQPIYVEVSIESYPPATASSGGITASDQYGYDIVEICTGTTISFTATTYPSYDNYYTYNWYLYRSGSGIPVGTDSTYYSNNDFLSGDTIHCQVNDYNMTKCLTGFPSVSNMIEINVFQKTGGTLTIAKSPTGTTCQNTIILFYISGLTYGGDNPTFQWKYYDGSWHDIVGETGITMLYVPSNGQSIKCTMTSNYFCLNTSTSDSNSLSITTTANLTPSVIIAPTGTTCSGTSVTYTAVGTNSGSTALLEWFYQRNSVWYGPFASTSYTYIPSNLDTIGVRMTSSLPCLTTNPATDYITADVSDILITSMEIQSNPMALFEDEVWICHVNAGSSVIFNKISVNGVCGSETYQWTKNGSNVSTDPTTYTIVTPIEGDYVQCTVDSDCQCTGATNPASSRIISININGVAQKSVYITCGSYNCNVICTGTTVCFTGSTAGFTSPTYQWKINGSNVGTNSLYYCSSSLANNDSVTLTATEGTSATSVPIVMTVTQKNTPVVYIYCDDNNVCSGTTVCFYINGGLYIGINYTFQWQIWSGSWTDIIGANTYYYCSNSLDNNTQIRLKLSNIVTPCITSTIAYSAPITVYIQPKNVPTVTITSNYNCIPISAVTFTATNNGVGSNWRYTWYRRCGNGSLQSYDSGTNNYYIASSCVLYQCTTFVIYCIMTVDDNGCVAPLSATSNNITLYPCSESTSSNLVLNGGGIGATDWIDSNSDGMGDNWWWDGSNSTLYSKNIDIGSIDNGFDIGSRFQRAAFIYYNSGYGGLHTANYSINLIKGYFKYNISFMFRCFDVDAIPHAIVPTISIFGNNQFRSIVNEIQSQEYVDLAKSHSSEFYWNNTHSDVFFGLAFLAYEDHQNDGGIFIDLDKINLTQELIYSFGNNLILNGGGDDTTFWINPVSGIANKWKVYDNPLIGGWTANVGYHWAGFSGSYQFITFNMSPGGYDKWRGLQTDPAFPLNVTMGCQRYHLYFQLYFSTSEPDSDPVEKLITNVWALFSDGSTQIIHSAYNWGNNNYPYGISAQWIDDVEIGTDIFFDVNNTISKKLSGIFVGQYLSSATTGDPYTYNLAIGTVNLWECVSP